MCPRCMSGTCRGQNRPSDLWKLELQAIVGCLMWVLGTEPQDLCKSREHSLLTTELSLQSSKHLINEKVKISNM